MKAVFKHN